MKFKTEYKREAQRISPTEEQCERIRNGVMSRLAEEQPAPKRKPLKIKIAAISTASACAAAVLIIVIGSHSFTKSMSDGFNQVLAPSMGAEGTGLSGGHAYDAPGYSPSDMQSADLSKPNADSEMPGSAFDSSSDLKTESMSPSTDTVQPGVQNSDTGIPGTVPSDNSGFGDKPDIYPDAPYLWFSENESRCTVMIDGELRVYRASEPADFTYDEKRVQSVISGFGNGHPDTSTLVELGYDGSLQPASSNLDIELFVQFDEDKMPVFTKNGKLYKFFSLI